MFLDIGIWKIRSEKGLDFGEICKLQERSISQSASLRGRDFFKKLEYWKLDPKWEGAGFVSGKGVRFSGLGMKTGF